MYKADQLLLQRYLHLNLLYLFNLLNLLYLFIFLYLFKDNNFAAGTENDSRYWEWQCDVKLNRLKLFAFPVKYEQMINS